MASIKWSALVSEVKGKLNGTIFSNSVNGATMRNRKSSSGKYSNLWQQSKQRLSVIASFWRVLDALQVATWESQRTNYPYIDKFGDQRTPSAYQLFCTLNSNLSNLGHSLIMEAVLPFPQFDLGIVAVTESINRNLFWTFTSPNDPTYKIMIYVSPPQSNGVYALPQRSKKLFVVEGDDPFAANLYQALADMWGEPRNGQKFFFQSYVVDLLTGHKYGTYLNTVTFSGVI